MTDDLSELKRKVAELEARQQATPAPSKPNTGGLAPVMRLIVLILVAMVGIAALANLSGVSLTGNKTTGVSTAADVVAYQKKAAQTGPKPNARANAADGLILEELVLAELRPQVSKCKAFVAKNKNIGRVEKDGIGGYFVEFDESIWNALIYDDKVKAALIVFCALMPTDGRTTVTLQGLRTHGTLGRVVNGHYFSG